MLVSSHKNYLKEKLHGAIYVPYTILFHFTEVIWIWGKFNLNVVIHFHTNHEGKKTTVERLM